MLRQALLVCLLALVGCSDDGGDSSPATATDSGAAKDSAVVDSSSADSAMVDSATGDSAMVDSTAGDSTAVDSATVADAAFDSVITWDTAGACHTFGFGAPAATIAKVASLPTMTGGVIAGGIYDVTAVQTTGTITGTYQATWSFVAGMKIEAIEQLTLSSPGATVPRILTWSTTGTSLTRTQICGGSSSFTNEYSVRSESGATFLDVRQDTLMFTFKKR